MNIKISVVSYINSYPFLYGLENFKQDYNFEIMHCPPSQCAKTAFNKTADIALVPTAAIPFLSEDYYLDKNFCIGAEKSVSSVLLLSNSPLFKLKRIYTDTHSMTSVKLLKLLIKNYWLITPEITSADINTDLKISKQEAIMAIGDKCFDLKKQYNYTIDLFDEWHAFTKLPIVFAVWTIKNNLYKDIIDVFIKALRYGISNREASLEAYLQDDKKKDFNFYLEYINQNISYIFDEKKQKAVSIYLNYIKNID